MSLEAHVKDGAFESYVVFHWIDGGDDEFDGLL